MFTTRRKLQQNVVSRRRGLALIVAMVAISAALVLTYAFVRTQTTALQISQNGARRDLALQAAETGAAVALDVIQSPDWEGVETPLSREVFSDSANTAFYTVTFARLTAENDGALPDDAALYMVIDSKGVWKKKGETESQVERHIEVVVRLIPRLEGRVIGPGDSSAANDRAPNTGQYDRIQDYALFAERGRTSLVLDPASRIDGDLWLDEHLKLYGDPYWSSSVRRAMLESIGQRYVSPSGTQHPHPLNGQITFDRSPRRSEKDDLDWLGVSWNKAASSIALPQFNLSDWQRYRLYAGGFEYEAVQIPYRLRNRTLEPTPDNPLGIFYRNGSVVLDDNVTIRGTLVCSETLQVAGNGVRLGSQNWRNEAGGEIVSNVGSWPRLPAIVARNVSIDRSVRFSVEGAVVVDGKFSGAGGDFQYVNAPAVSLDGTATSRPLGQPFSEVQLKGSPNILVLTEEGSYSIWLEDGTTGGWHEIVGVDRSARRLTVVGEVEHQTPTTYRIRRTRLRYADIHGPLACERTDINRPDAWMVPTGTDWSELHTAWKQENEDREDEGLEPILFVDWLGDPSHFSDWGFPIREYGLGLEPTFHLRNTDGIAYQWSPPLLQAFDAVGEDSQFAGYRWKLISWRERK